MAAFEQAVTLDEALRARLVAFTEVPLVDLTALVDGSDPAAVAARIGRAAEEVGFL